MRIIYITNNLSGTDGWSRYSLDLISEVKRQGHDIFCIVNDETADYKNYEKKLLGLPLQYLFNPWLTYKTSKKINQVIKDFKPEVIHFIVEPYASILYFLKAENYKVVLTVHGTYAFIPNSIKGLVKKQLSQYLTNSVYSIADQIIAVSNYTKNYLLYSVKNKSNLEKKISIITNGVPSLNYQYLPPQNKIKKILFVGAIKSRKGLLEAIDGLKFYHDNFSDNFIFDIIGNYSRNDWYYQKLMKKIKEYNLGSSIYFHGKVTHQELENYYRVADLFLMTPININFEFEGFGLVYLEANIRGVPCIGSLACGAQDAIIEGRTGYLVDPYNKKDMAEKINLVLVKHLISPQECINWAQENNIKNKTDRIIELYKFDSVRV